MSYLDSYMQYYTGSSLDWDYTLSDGTNITDYIKSNVYSSVKQHLVLENLANKYGVTLRSRRARRRSLRSRDPPASCRR